MTRDMTNERDHLDWLENQRKPREVRAVEDAVRGVIEDREKPSTLARTLAERFGHSAGYWVARIRKALADAGHAIPQRTGNSPRNRDRKFRNKALAGRIATGTNKPGKRSKDWAFGGTSLLVLMLLTTTANAALIFEAQPTGGTETFENPFIHFDESITLDRIEVAYPTTLTVWDDYQTFIVTTNNQGIADFGGVEMTSLLSVSSSVAQPASNQLLGGWDVIEEYRLDGFALRMYGTVGEIPEPSMPLALPLLLLVRMRKP